MNDDLLRWSLWTRDSDLAEIVPTFTGFGELKPPLTSSRQSLGSVHSPRGWQKQISSEEILLEHPGKHFSQTVIAHNPSREAITSLAVSSPLKASDNTTSVVSNPNSNTLSSSDSDEDTTSLSSYHDSKSLK